MKICRLKVFLRTLRSCGKSTYFSFSIRSISILKLWKFFPITRISVLPSTKVHIFAFNRATGNPEGLKFNCLRVSTTFWNIQQYLWSIHTQDSLEIDLVYHLSRKQGKRGGKDVNVTWALPSFGLDYSAKHCEAYQRFREKHPLPDWSNAWNGSCVT